MEHWTKRLSIGFALMMAIAVIGCESPTAPAMDEAPVAVQATAAATTTDASAPVGWLPGWSSNNEEELKRKLETEKSRLALTQENSKRKYDRLKERWERFTKRNHGKYDSPFLMCDPLQYTGDTKIIGPEGGDMSIGPHKLSIPAGALTKPTVITGEQPTSLLVEVKLSGHGLQFAKPVTLELSYKHCYVPSDFQYRMVYIDGANNILEWPTSYDNKQAGEVTGWIEHFSRYAVATN